jgi:GT2 family glycosyltransferase
MGRPALGDSDMTVARTLEDTPFYSRSVLSSDGTGAWDTVHESLDLDRFASRWVQFLLPFRGVIGQSILVFSGAGNLGADHASSNRFVFMDPDVIPAETGWLTRLHHAYDAAENPGAIGVRLLLDDNSIQHVGLTFVRDDRFHGVWREAWLRQGMPQWVFPQEKKLQPIGAVSAACVMLDRQAFQSVGGFYQNHILGGFEGSDLCLKLFSAGYVNYIAHDVVLYHVKNERNASLSGIDWEGKLALYNSWRHTKRWGNTIDTLLKEANGDA